jgi:ElaB/YqjD/DUF883 family membrane-anchored ribosome-binding protein
MAAEPDEIRSRIEVTRSDLAADVDQLADRTSPTRIMQRGRARVGSRMRTIRERVMGTPAAAARATADSTRDLAGRTAEAAEQAADVVREAPERVAEQTRGNPLAVGLVAFGAGLLAATLLPETRVEQDAARRLADSDLAEQIRQPLSESATQLREDVSQDLKDSASEVGQRAKDAATATVEDAKQAARS